MHDLFDEFDLEVQKISMDITLYSESGGDSIAVCSGGSGGSSGDASFSYGPTCWNICA